MEILDLVLLTANLGEFGCKVGLILIPPMMEDASSFVSFLTESSCVWCVDEDVGRYFIGWSELKSESLLCFNIEVDACPEAVMSCITVVSSVVIVVPGCPICVVLEFVFVLAVIGGLRLFIDLLRNSVMGCCWDTLALICYRLWRTHCVAPRSETDTSIRHSVQ